MNVLYVVGLGPGGSRWMTWEARAALEQAEVLCGYTVYLDLIRGEFPDKEYFSTPMTQEIERCRAALERARSGRTTALVCSGDAGVYGMAGPVLELAPQFPEVEIQVVPGVTAALAGAAVLGAPLMRGALSVRPAHPLGGHPPPPGAGGSGGLCPLPLQPLQPAAAGPFAHGL